MIGYDVIGYEYVIVYKLMHNREEWGTSVIFIDPFF
jgi:hypothetical protein